MKLFNNKKNIGKKGVKITQDILNIIECDSTMKRLELKEIRNIIMEELLREQGKIKYAIVLVGGVRWKKNINNIKELAGKKITDSNNAGKIFAEKSNIFDESTEPLKKVKILNKKLPRADKKFNNELYIVAIVKDDIFTGKRKWK